MINKSLQLWNGEGKLLLPYPWVRKYVLKKTGKFVQYYTENTIQDFRNLFLIKWSLYFQFEFQIFQC